MLKFLLISFGTSLVVLSPVFAASKSSEDAMVSYVARYFPKEVRAFDGTGNNKKFTKAGTPESLFERLSYADYADQKSEPSSRSVNPREISVNFFQDRETQNEKGASDYLWLWGQFVDHDLTLTDTNPGEFMNIAVPKCDRFFDVSCAGNNEMVFTRSESVMVDGVREHFNRTTSYLDGSMVYGPNQNRAHTLRTMDGTGKMILGKNGYLPKNTFGLQNLPSDSPHFYAAGDIRANDHIGLMAMHNLFVREHNYWASKIKKKKSSLTGEEVYQRARAIVIAEIQNITFNEFLPMLIGTYAPDIDSRYNRNLKAAIFTEFSTAAFRMGHTFVSGELYLETMKGEGSFVKLRNSFFNPHEYERAGMNSILLGFSKHMAQDRDPMINTELQNFLMIFPVEGIFDLFSFNIQRGRDHGIPSYNDLRENRGFTRVRTFAEISKHGEFNEALSNSYDSVDDIDPWLGLIAEKASNNALLGTTASSIIAQQFRLLRDADRFWFTNRYAKSFSAAVKAQTLADIVARNTKIEPKMLNAKGIFDVN